MSQINSMNHESISLWISGNRKIVCFKGAISLKNNHLLSVSLKYHLKINHKDAFGFSISCHVLEIFIF